MGFFTEFNAWLTSILSTYISANTAAVAAALTPAILTLATCYIMVWGYMQLTGRVEEPVMAGVRRIAVLALVLGVSLKLWLYNDLIVDTFFNAPGELAARVVGAFDPVGIVDQIMFAGDDIGRQLLAKAGIIHGFSFAIAGCVVYAIVGFTAVYTMFLLALSRIALSVLLALGPLYIALLFFESTKRFFGAWIAQLANYALIGILTVLVAALMLTVISSAAASALSSGGGIQIAEALRVCLAAGLTLLVMRQVMPMAAGLSTGLALSTFGVTSALIAWGLGKGIRGSGQFGRGLFDRQSTRWDSLSRKGGYYVKRGIGAGFRA
ncbi:MAG: type IV secretion system protein, partial [Steroidobacteraceae bacterium]